MSSEEELEKRVMRRPAHCLTALTKPQRPEYEQNHFPMPELVFPGYQHYQSTTSMSCLCERWEADALSNHSIGRMEGRTWQNRKEGGHITGQQSHSLEQLSQEEQSGAQSTFDWAPVNQTQPWWR